MHPTNISQKIEVIVEHFRGHVRTHLGGRAKAMAVTGSRLQAVKYMEAFQRYINENGYTDIRPLVAFSGMVRDPETGLEYTEPGMNTDVVSGKPISEKQLTERSSRGLLSCARVKETTASKAPPMSAAARLRKRRLHSLK